MKTKKIKARKMWGNNEAIYASNEDAKFQVMPWKPDSFMVIPADAASIDAMLEQANQGIMATSDGRAMTTRGLARAALAAIGINARAPKS